MSDGVGRALPKEKKNRQLHFFFQRRSGRENEQEDTPGLGRRGCGGVEWRRREMDQTARSLSTKRAIDGGPKDDLCAKQPEPGLPFRRNLSNANVCGQPPSPHPPIHYNCTRQRAKGRAPTLAAREPLTRPWRGLEKRATHSPADMNKLDL